MRLRRLLAIASGSAVVLALVVPAGDAVAAQGFKCASAGTITKQSGAGYVYWYGSEAPDGAKYTGRTMSRGNHFYETHGKRSITLSWGRTIYRIAPNSVFQLSCSGRSAKEGLIFPSLDMLVGRAVVTSAKNHEGSVITWEGLFGQLPYKAGTTFVVARHLTSNKAPTLAQKQKWYFSYSSTPRGTTSVRKLRTAKVNVTPYVGPKLGSCREVRSAALTSNAGRGRAVYHF